MTRFLRGGVGMGWIKHQRSGRLRDRGRGNRHTPRSAESRPTPLGSFYQFRDASMDCLSQSGSGWKVKQPAPQWSLSSILCRCSGQQNPIRLNKKREDTWHACAPGRWLNHLSIHQVCGPEDRSRNEGKDTWAESTFHRCGTATQVLSSLSTQDPSAVVLSRQCS